MRRHYRPKSAWRVWQDAGMAWKKEHPNASPEDVAAASSAFGHEDSIGNPDAAYGARKRAFIEGTAQ